MEFHQGWPGVWLVIAAFIAGMLNAVAGGGSFLSFPPAFGWARRLRRPRPRRRWPSGLAPRRPRPRLPQPPR